YGERHTPGMEGPGGGCSGRRGRRPPRDGGASGLPDIRHVFDLSGAGRTGVIRRRGKFFFASRLGRFPRPTAPVLRKQALVPERRRRSVRTAPRLLSRNAGGRSPKIFFSSGSLRTVGDLEALSRISAKKCAAAVLAFACCGVAAGDVESAFDEGPSTPARRHAIERSRKLLADVLELYPGT